MWKHIPKNVTLGPIRCYFLNLVASDLVKHCIQLVAQVTQVCWLIVARGFRFGHPFPLLRVLATTQTHIWRTSSCTISIWRFSSLASLLYVWIRSIKPCLSIKLALSLLTSKVCLSLLPTEKIFPCHLQPSCSLSVCVSVCACSQH